MFWGWFSDNYGRRCTMILTSISNAILILALGLSRNYTGSLIIRFLHGMLDSSLGVSKTIAADLCNDNNMAFGTSLLYTGFGIGRYAGFALINRSFLGPLLGGYLSDLDTIRPLINVFPFLKSVFPAFASII